MADTQPTAPGPSPANTTRNEPQVPAAGADVPPQEATQTDYNDTDALFKELNRSPFFMTELPEDDGQENVLVEALKSMAYEGTRDQIADNFKNQGAEAVAEKRWLDAREFYSKALAALKGPKIPSHLEEGDPTVKVVEVEDEEEVEKKEKALEQACLANRALCQLEMKNYGSCNKDCASVLKMNPRNVKAWYRAASACLALDKLPEALDAAECGLRFDPNSKPLAALKERIEKRVQSVEELNRWRVERVEREAREKSNLKFAIRSRNILSRSTPNPPDMEDAKISLADVNDPKSVLSFPIIFLYPLEAQSDFIKACAEDETLGDHLEYVLPPPWDQQAEYTPEETECYMETVSGGLIKAGKKLILLKLLSGGKIEVTDELVKVNVVPKKKASIFIEEFKKRKGKQ
ncbi:hypothetical protein Q7P37_005214 [Cladosporium fusiforme]